MQFPPEGRPVDDFWVAPLIATKRALEFSTALADQFFETTDFMLMGRIARSPRPRIYLYKHFHTRSYLNLDEAGHAYRYLPPRSNRVDSSYLGQYRPHKDLRAAIDNLGLWELPWMKPGLEAFRCGLPWSERWDLRDYDTGDLRREPHPPVHWEAW